MAKQTDEQAIQRQGKSMISHTQKELIKNIAVVTLLQGADEDGKNMYIYLGVRGDLYNKFISVQQSKKPFDPEEYGVIITSGSGSPDQKTKTYMNREFGFNHENPLVSPQAE